MIVGQGNFFRGIVEALGTVLSIEENPGMKTFRFWIQADESLLSPVKKGDHIAVNGVCLTVKEIQADKFRVDIWPDTFRQTNLSDTHPGQRVNIERRNDDNYIDVNFCHHI